MTTKRGLGRAEDHRAAWEESYPHPFISALMPGIALLAIMALVLLAFNLWERSLPGDVTVPQVEGMATRNAMEQLERIGLNVELVRERKTSETIPEDHVIAATPEGGRQVKVGRTVRLVLSAGSAYTTVPDVRQLTQALARDTLQDAGLLVNEEQYQHDEKILFDRVISLTPPPGSRVAKMSGVKLVISKGPKEDAYPDIARPAPRRGVPVLKSTMLNVTLPTDGEPTDTVRIDVVDGDGERTIYQKDHDAGETIVQTVQGKGDVTTKVYYGNRLVLTRTF